MRIRRGVCYLLENETSETAYRLFLRLLPEQEAGFCLSRMHPEKVRTRFGSASVRIGWLAEVPGEDHFSANAMACAAKAVQQFIQEDASSATVLVDGLEHVILHNVCQPTLPAFVEHFEEFPMGTTAALPLPPPALKPNPLVARAFPERRPDFVGLIGVAFFLLIVGIVFTLNTNLLNDLRFWSDLIVANGLFVRPPDGIIASGIIFFGLLGLSNFLTSGLRWILDRSRFGALARVLAGVGFLSLAFLTWRYSLRAMSGSLVISVWTAILGTFLVIYIAVGLYWVRARRPAPTGARVPTSRP